MIRIRPKNPKNRKGIYTLIRYPEFYKNEYPKFFGGIYEFKSDERIKVQNYGFNFIF